MYNRGKHEATIALITDLQATKEHVATVVLQAMPEEGDLRIRIDGDQIHFLCEHVRHLYQRAVQDSFLPIALSGDIKTVLVGHRDGTWTATDASGMVEAVHHGADAISGTPSWEPPAIDEALMVSIDEVKRATAEAKAKALKDRDADSVDLLFNLRKRLLSECRAHRIPMMRPRDADMLIMVSGKDLIEREGIAPVERLLRCELAASCELFDGRRWVAYGNLELLKVLGEKSRRHPRHLPA